MTQAPNQTQRREQRLTIASVNLPFLATRGDTESAFQYLLVDVSASGCRIALPSWLVKRERLEQGDEVDFHMPFRIGGRLLGAGRVVWVRDDDEWDGQLCGVELEGARPRYYPVTISPETSDVAVDLTDFDGAGGLALRLIKDAHLMKKGVAVYLRHLSSLSLRYGGLHRDEQAEMRAFLFDGANALLGPHIGYLASLRSRLAENPQQGLTTLLDLDEVREAMEPEVDQSVWRLALSTEEMVDYLRAIAELEKRLYVNFNALVMLYQRELEAV